MATLRTRTVKSSGGDYSSLNGYEAGEEADLPALDEIRRAECYAMADTSAVIFSGWVTDATRYQEIVVVERHDGKWNAGRYRLTIADGDAFDTRIDHQRITGLQVEITTPTATTVCFTSSTVTAADHRLEACIFRTHTDSAFSSVCAATNLTHASSVLRIKNCVMQDRTNNSASRVISENSTTSYIHNNTLKTLNGTAIRGFLGTMNLRNTAWAVGSGTGLVNSGVTFVPNNCISTDGSADDFGGSGNQVDISESSMAFVDAANGDFHIGPTSSLKDQGADLSADSNYAVTDDIDGAPRSAPFDVGADEITVAGLSVNIGEAQIGGSLF